MQTGTRTGPRRIRAERARTSRRAARVAFFGALLAGVGLAQEPIAKPDIVYAEAARGGTIKPVSGTLLAHELAGVVIATQGREERIPAERVVRVQFGDAPPSFNEGLDYMARGEFTAAAQAFEVAASQTTARDMVRAAARLALAEALLAAGAQDPNAFAQAREQAARFLQESPADLGASRARVVEARALWLGGDTAGAAARYAELFREAPDGRAKPGYDLLTCMRAGLYAVRTFLSAGDTLGARESKTELERTLGAALDGLNGGTESGDLRAELETVRQEARIVDGELLLASRDFTGARTYFEQLLSGAEEGESHLRFGARLGLAEALLGAGEGRRAWLEFAAVAAIDHTDRDRAARALLGLSECSLQLSDKDATKQARIRLETLLAYYGNTPSARPARELLAKL